MMHLEKIVTGDNDKQEQVLMPIFKFAIIN